MARKHKYTPLTCKGVITDEQWPFQNQTHITSPVQHIHLDLHTPRSTSPDLFCANGETHTHTHTHIRRVIGSLLGRYLVFTRCYAGSSSPCCAPLTRVDCRRHVILSTIPLKRPPFVRACAMNAFNLKHVIEPVCDECWQPERKAGDALTKQCESEGC